MELNQILVTLWESTGLHSFLTGEGYKNILMIGVGLLLIYLAIKKKFEPLLLLPIGFGAILSNIPLAQIADSTELVGSLLEEGSQTRFSLHDIQAGFIGIFYDFGVASGLFPLLIFMGVGAMTDFGPLIANPKTLILGAAAQFGIFGALLGATGLGFALNEAASIAIIGGADGPTAIFTTSILAPDLLGPVAVSAYSYMALVPIIQPPLMKMLTTKEERNIKMTQLRVVSKKEKIIFPITVLGICILLLPTATPLLGAFMLGNLAKESGVVDRLSDTMQNALINIVTIMLGLAVGSKMQAELFLNFGTIKILLIGLIAFSIGTIFGVLIAKVMNLFSRNNPVNPLIGAAGVSAVPMSARVVNKVGLEANKNNHLLMHAMGPNVAGVIGSAVAAGILLTLVP